MDGRLASSLTGKSGIDIRYYLSATKDAPTAPVKATEPEYDPYAEQNDIPLDSIPFKEKLWNRINDGSQ